MKNIQLERQYLHKNTFKIHQLSKRQVESQYNTNFFSLLAPRKGIGALAPSMRECAQKLQQGKRTYK